jgi:hypothetical protein
MWNGIDYQESIFTILSYVPPRSYESKSISFYLICIDFC